jgi:hypothetical protein
MHADREHVISVVLNHDDWKEFVKLQPQPVNWLRDRIQEMIDAASRASSGIGEPHDMARGGQGTGVSSVQGSRN